MGICDNVKNSFFGHIPTRWRSAKLWENVFQYEIKRILILKSSKWQSSPTGKHYPTIGHLSMVPSSMRSFPYFHHAVFQRDDTTGKGPSPYSYGLTPLNRRSLQTVQGLYCLVEFGQVTLPLIESIKQW